MFGDFTFGQPCFGQLGRRLAAEAVNGVWRLVRPQQQPRRDRREGGSFAVIGIRTTGEGLPRRWTIAAMVGVRVEAVGAGMRGRTIKTLKEWRTEAA